MCKSDPGDDDWNEYKDLSWEQMKCCGNVVHSKCNAERLTNRYDLSRTSFGDAVNSPAGVYEVLPDVRCTQACDGHFKDPTNIAPQPGNIHNVLFGRDKRQKTVDHGRFDVSKRGIANAVSSTEDVIVSWGATSWTNYWPHETWPKRCMEEKLTIS